MTGQTSTAPISATSAPEQGADLASLQSQVADLRVQLTGLKAQWDGLYTQLDRMLKTNPARPGMQQQWADVGVQIARVEGDIARLDARIAQKQGVPVGATSLPPRFPRSIDPNAVIPAVVVVTLALVLPMSIAWARRIIRGAPRPTPVPHDLTMRLERIEQAVDTIAIEVERVSEGQRFVTKVLVGRPVPDSSDPPPGDLPSAQAKPPLALGAGPMEPIVVAERERARQRVVTPH
jgi:hypothetical protein